MTRKSCPDLKKGTFWFNNDLHLCPCDLFFRASLGVINTDSNGCLIFSIVLQYAGKKSLFGQLLKKSLSVWPSHMTVCTSTHRDGVHDIG